MNDDRISEVYKDEIWTEEAPERARRRIHWMIRQVRGDRVLDVGCSQGIASILLGREGFDVVGVDIQSSRIEDANADLALEAPATRERVRFIVGEGADLQFEDDYFDTVILGDVIEHLAAPDRVLAEALRVLRPGGVAVITTPFGVLRHHDHIQTFYTEDVYTLISAYFGVTSAEVADRYFRIVGEKGADSDPAILESLRGSAVRAVRGIQEDLADVRVEANRLSSEVEKLASSRNEQRKRAEALAKRLEEAQEANVENERQYRSALAELKRATDQAKQAARTSEELARARKTLDRRERDVAKLRYRLAVSDWKLASLRQRRWWRVGSELGAVRKRPLSLLTLPFRLLKVIRTRAEPLPRPVPPSELSVDQGAGDELQRVGSQPDAVVPARDIVALAMVDEELRDILSHEVLLFSMNPDGWESQLESLAPSLLFLDSNSADRLSPSELDHLLAAAAATGTRTVLWDDDPGVVSPTVKTRFDVLCGDGKPPLDDYEGRLVERQGWIQPRVHNPIGGHQRPLESSTVDIRRLTIGDVKYESTAALSRAARSYKVLKVDGEVTDPIAAPIAASATPLIVSASSTELGLIAETEEEAHALERSIMRSAALRGRLTHPLMRSIMRERSISRDIDAVLGADVHHWPAIDVMVATNRPDNLGNILENLGRQTYPDFRLFLVAHGIEIDEPKAREEAEQAGVQLEAVVRVPESVILGEVFNIGFAETEAATVAKVDDDDFYGAEYLWDLYSALDFSGAEVAGKWAHYAYLEGPDALVLRYPDYEHRFTDVVAISTLLMHREVLEAERFPEMPWGSGSVFLRALGARGARVFAADRWNYLYVRGRDGNRNTFPMSDLKLLSISDIVCRGLNTDEVVL